LRLASIQIILQIEKFKLRDFAQFQHSSRFCYRLW
jgi:hypothetical protein